MATKTPPKNKPTPRKAGGTPAKRQPAAKSAAPKKMGRPSIHTPKLAADYCQLLMEGHDLRSASEQPGMPSMTTVMRWLHDDLHNFRAQYAQAREVQAELDHDEIRRLVDAPARTITLEWSNHKDVSKRVPVLVAIDSAEVALRRLQMDARKWSASKKAPKRYGEKLDLTGDGIPMVLVKDMTGRKGERPEPAGE